MESIIVSSWGKNQVLRILNIFTAKESGVFFMIYANKWQAFSTFHFAWLRGYLKQCKKVQRPLLIEKQFPLLLPFFLVSRKSWQQPDFKEVKGQLEEADTGTRKPKVSDSWECEVTYIGVGVKVEKVPGSAKNQRKSHNMYLRLFANSRHENGKTPGVADMFASHGSDIKEVTRLWRMLAVTSPFWHAEMISINVGPWEVRQID